MTLWRRSAGSYSNYLRDYARRRDYYISPSTWILINRSIRNQDYAVFRSAVNYYWRQVDRQQSLLHESIERIPEYRFRN